MDLTSESKHVAFLLLDEFLSDEAVVVYALFEKLFQNTKKTVQFFKFRTNHIHHLVDHNIWLNDYNEFEFFQLFRMKKATFDKLFDTIIENDDSNLIKKKYRGGNYPIQPEKGLLVFLWYMSKQDTLLSIADRFSIVPSTVMNIVNAYLYIVIYRLKKKYIFWPKTEEEYQFIVNDFKKYPNVIGTVDGSHINVKVPEDQHDSYVNRYQSHSINLMGICTARKIFTYIFVGYPGSAHDSRVFSNSSLVLHIDNHGEKKYFPREEYHLIGDSAFPLRTWLMTPYPKRHNLNRTEKNHNFCLSSARVCIENTFGILKIRWARLHYINTYSISKAVEIITAACILHNFCYLNHDEWECEGIVIQEHGDEQERVTNDREAYRLGSEKRDNIAAYLLNNIGCN